MRAVLRAVIRAARRWWPAGYCGLLGGVLVADWQSRSLSELRWQVAAAWVLSAVWFLSWRLAHLALHLERRDHQAHHIRRPPVVPAPRRTPENGPYEHWLN